MDLSENEAYEYDKSLFFKLLESNRFCGLFKLVQEQQGVVVCPLEIKTRPFNSADLIEKHLFLPSPYYRNRFVPIIYTSNSISSSTSAGGSSRLSFQATAAEFNVNLIINENNTTAHEFNLICNGKSICTNVKLLKIEIGYSEVNNRPYRILVVDREVTFGITRPPEATFGSGDNFDDNILVSDLPETTSTDNLMTQKTKDTIKKRASSVSLTTGLLSLKDVNTFSKAIDFLHNTVCFLEENTSTSSDFSGVVRRSEMANNKRLVKVTIGENYLEEIDLFKKTYVILYTHLSDFINQAQRLFMKYTNQFNQALFINGLAAEHCEGVTSVAAIACEIVINGCLFAKLWPAVVKANEREDTRLVNRMNLIRIKLGVNSIVSSSVEEDDLDESTLNQCVEFFHLDRVFFAVNLKPVLKELRKVELLNNPFERLESVKASVDLLVNELTILSLGKRNQTDTNDVLTVTSENLIPLIAFVLLRSSLVNLKSAVYYVDNFSFASSLSHVASNSYLAELTYFMTSFKASLAFIENS